MPLDLTDWATLLEVLDGIKAPFPPLSVLAAAHPRAGENLRVVSFMPPPPTHRTACSVSPRSQ